MDQYLNPLTHEYESNEGISGAQLTSGAIKHYPDDINTENDLLSRYQYTSAAGHHLRFQRTVNGQAIISLVADPAATNTISYLDYMKAAKMPMALEYEASYAGRGRVAHAGIVIGDFDNTLMPNLAQIEVSQWWVHGTDSTTDYVSASGSYMVLNLVSPLPLDVHIGDWISITGTSDNAAQTTGFSGQEFPNAPIRHISNARTRVVISVADEAGIALANIATKTTIPGTMFISFFQNMVGATHGMGTRFSSSNATQAAMFTAMGGDCFMSSPANDIRGDQRSTTGTTAPIYPVGSFGQGEIRPTTRFRMEARVDECAFQDQTCDGANIQANRITRSSVKPNADMLLRPRAYMRVPKGSTTVAGRITSISKAGTTTCTVTTDTAHGLKVADWVTIRGVLDQVNFASSTTSAVVASIVSATQFTVVWGTAVTMSSYGGVVLKHRGGLELPGIAISQAATAVTWNSTTQLLVITGSSTWTGMSIGDIVALKGCLKSAGVDTGLDGLWRVHHYTTTELTLTPISDAFGTRVSPNPGNYTGAAGGFVVICPEFRIHDLSVEDWTEHRVIIDGAGVARADKAIPTFSMGGTYSVTQGGAGAVGASGTGSWIVRPGVAAIADVASAAITATATSASLANDLGNGFQITVPVTAVSGTTPTLDIRIEESFDGGTNWVTLYEMQRITATGSYNTPILRASGRNIRYVRTVGGTTPSFTMAITRNVMPFLPAEPQKRLIDRTIVPNTLNSVTPTLFMGAANNVQLVVNMGAIATTAPDFKLQGSEDNTNWFDIDTGLLAVANSTVEKTINARSCTFVRAIVSTAGVGATLGYVSIKAWS